MIPCLYVLLICWHTNLGGAFKYLLFSPLFGEDQPILTSIFFQRGWNHQLEICIYIYTYTYSTVKWHISPPSRYHKPSRPPNFRSMASFRPTGDLRWILQDDDHTGTAHVSLPRIWMVWMVWIRWNSLEGSFFEEEYIICIVCEYTVVELFREIHSCNEANS